MMKREHTYKLQEIAQQTSYTLSQLMETYSNKTSDYVLRDLRLGKSFSPLHATSQRERAITVMEQYANRKSGYISPDWLVWIMR